MVARELGCGTRFFPLLFHGSFMYSLQTPEYRLLLYHRHDLGRCPISRSWMLYSAP